MFSMRDARPLQEGLSYVAFPAKYSSATTILLAILQWKFISCLFCCSFKQPGIVTEGQGTVHDVKGDDLQQNENFIYRNYEKSPGIYVKGRINDSYVVFTIDTGASRTILSKSVFDGLETKPKLHPTTGILNACGREVRVFGEAKFTLKLGDFLADQHIIVADIDDDCLLGVDVLYAEQNMPAEILLSEGILKLRNKEIPCFQTTTGNRCRRVTAADNYQIPPFSEKIIQAFVERSDNPDERKELLIEPAELFTERYELLMANTLVDIEDSTTVPVRLLNLTHTEQYVHQDAIIGVADEFAYDVLLHDSTMEKPDDTSGIIREITEKTIEKKCRVT